MDGEQLAEHALAAAASCGLVSVGAVAKVSNLRSATSRRTLYMHAHRYIMVTSICASLAGDAALPEAHHG